ncbi:MAG TPA: hypothetical protein VJQ06_05220 [Rhizomicrobium sp.]|nr:hypothetical protein [Rhizomicrobium sp.]
MTLPSSGPLSLSAIQGEFGGSNPIGLSEYYAGGGLVPSGTTSPVAGAVPSSVGTPISIYNFYGTTKFTGRVDDLTSPGTTDVQVPSGAVSVLIECVAGGGGGGNGDYDLNQDLIIGGGGGASGSACIKTMSLNGTDTGVNIHCVVGGATTNSTVTATLSSGSVNMTANAGGYGGSASVPIPGTGGIHGSATGGDTNIDGSDGGDGTGGSSGVGGSGGSSVLLGAGTGGDGGTPFGPGPYAGDVGRIRLTFS